LGQGFIDLRVRSRERFLRPIILLTAFSRGPEQLFCATEVDLCQRQRCLALIESGDASVQKGDLVVEVLHGALQFPPSASGFCFNTARLGVGRLQVRLCGVDRRSLLRDHDLIRLPVEFSEKLSFTHTVIVIHQNPGNLAADAGATNVTCPFTYASSVETVLSISRIQGKPNKQTTTRTTAPSTPIRSQRLRVD
jgi:hypothetical protein